MVSNGWWGLWGLLVLALTVVIGSTLLFIWAIERMGR